MEGMKYACSSYWTQASKLEAVVDPRIQSWFPVFLVPFPIFQDPRLIMIGKTELNPGLFLESGSAPTRACSSGESPAPACLPGRPDSGVWLLLREFRRP